MKNAYVERKEGGYWVAGTRVSLDSLVYAFRRGASPETIRDSFPVLTLEEVYGALTFYLAHQSKIDRYLKVSEDAADQQAAARRERLKADVPKLVERLRNVEATVR